MTQCQPSYYRARIDFTFGGVKVRAGQPVPCHRAPWSVLLNAGARFVEAVYDEAEQ